MPITGLEHPPNPKKSNTHSTLRHLGITVTYVKHKRLNRKFASTHNVRAAYHWEYHMLLFGLQGSFHRWVSTDGNIFGVSFFAKWPQIWLWFLHHYMTNSISKQYLYNTLTLPKMHQFRCLGSRTWILRHRSYWHQTRPEQVPTHADFGVETVGQ